MNPFRSATAAQPPNGKPKADVGHLDTFGEIHFRLSALDQRLRVIEGKAGGTHEDERAALTALTEGTDE